MEDSGVITKNKKPQTFDYWNELFPAYTHICYSAFQREPIKQYSSLLINHAHSFFFCLIDNHAHSYNRNLFQFQNLI